MNKSSKPNVFISSSSEGSAYANEIKARLDSIAECSLWSPEFCELGKGVWESILNQIDEYDFAILVWTADDLTASSGNGARAPRDNALLELGVLLGSLGRGRTFIVVDHGCHCKLPVGLEAIAISSVSASEDGEPQAGLENACDMIEQAIAVEGFRNNRSRLRFDSQMTHERKEGNQLLTIKITNLSSTPLPPFRISLQGTPVGSISFFDYERRVVLLTNQHIAFTFVMFENHEPTEMLRHVVRWSEYGDKFTLKLIQDESDGYVVFENAELGSSLRNFLRNALKDRNTSASEFLGICRGEF